MKKICMIALFVFAVILYTHPAYPKNSSAEECVKNFYTWYITEDLKQDAPFRDPLDNPDIYKYVDHCTVNNIRIFYERDYIDVNYFTKSQDLWKEWLDDLVIHKEIKLTETVSIVPVSFKYTDDVSHNIIAFVRNENGNFYITKLVGTDRFYE